MAGNRHDWSEGTCSLLRNIAIGRAVDTLLEESIVTASALVVLPTWAWRLARLDVGRKDTGDEPGKRKLLPIPIVWEGGPVHLVTNQSVVGYTIDGLGHHERGEVTLETDSVLNETVFDGVVDDVPSSVRSPILTVSELRSRMQELSDNGMLSVWYMRQRVTNIIRKALDAANYAVAREIFGVDGRRTVLDEEQIEKLLTVFLYGEGDVERDTPTGAKKAATRCAMDRILERMLTKINYNKVDLHRYFRQAVKVDAEALVRGEVGDPHIGRKVRALASVREYESLDDLIRQYNEVHPRDHLSMRRAAAALLVTMACDPHNLSLVDRNGVEHDHGDPDAAFEDQLVSQLSAKDDLNRLKQNVPRIAEILHTSPEGFEDLLLERIVVEPGLTEQLREDPEMLVAISCDSDRILRGEAFGV